MTSDPFPNSESTCVGSSSSGFHSCFLTRAPHQTYGVEQWTRHEPELGLESQTSGAAGDMAHQTTPRPQIFPVISPRDRRQSPRDHSSFRWVRYGGDHSGQQRQRLIHAERFRVVHQWADFWVSASVITNATLGARLALIPQSSGAAGEITISSDTTGDMGSSTTPYNPASPAGGSRRDVQAVGGTDAALSVDGIPIDSASDTVGNLGVTLTLSGVTHGFPARQPSNLGTPITPPSPPTTS